MRRLGTNQLWSNYSLAGRKGKLPLRELPVFRLVHSEFETVLLLRLKRNITQSQLRHAHLYAVMYA